MEPKEDESGSEDTGPGRHVTNERDKTDKRCSHK